MLNKNLYDEENETINSNESLDPSNEIATENLPAKAEDLENLDPVTEGALKFRYSIFNGTSGIRSVVDDKKQIWFVADDVCKILEYKNTSKAIADHCGKVVDTDNLDSEHTLANKALIKTEGGSQNMLVISEGDLYRLVIRSRMPEARKFEAWVVDEVLPSIRKTGKYKVTRKVEISDPEEAAKYEETKKELATQCELFPRMVPSVSLPTDITDRLNNVKQKLFQDGHTFGSNKDFVKFLINKALEDLEG